jgi:hypothetical protein
MIRKLPKCGTKKNRPEFHTKIWMVSAEKVRTSSTMDVCSGEDWNSA